MNSNRWDAWPAQQPPPDFAERTVAAVLRERRPRRVLRRRRSAIVGAMAAVMVAGAAWGFTAWSGGRTAPARVPAAPPEAPTHVVSATRLPDAPASRDAGSEETAATPPPARRAPPPPPPPPSRPHVTPDAGRRVMVPRCECTADDVLCSCL